MSRKARIAVVGAGWWAVQNHIPVLQRNPDCELVGVNRLGAEELAALQRRFAIPEASEDAVELLDRVKPDGVVVASPHVLHHEHAAAALGRGCHVLVEKPLATRSEDARDLVARARRAGRAILVPYGWNFSRWAREARRLVGEGQIGRVEHVVLQMGSALEDLFAGQPMAETHGHMFRPPPSTWADPKRAGGYGWGQLVHALGLLFRIADLAPREVFAMTGASPAGVDYYDAATVRFEGGATAALSGASTVPKHRGPHIDLRIYGSEGLLLLDIERERLEVRRRDGRDTTVPMALGEGDYGCERPVDVFVDLCLGRDVENDAPGEVGMRAVEVLDAMYRSAVSGQVERV
jgi:predicted dehydrogenase